MIHVLRLTPLTDGFEAAEFRLGPGQEMIIGRSPDATFRVADLSAGRLVVRLSHTPAGVWVKDLASGGGSALEAGGTVTGRPDCLLPDGAILRLGGVEYRVSIDRVLLRRE